MAKKIYRESNFELLRIIAMIMIVLYHLLYQSVYGNTQIGLYRALWLPLHIGVVIFVLISGYFGIKPKISGLLNLMLKVLILVVPLYYIYTYTKTNNIYDALSCFFFISRSPHWYVRVYVCLYLISPIINAFLRGSSNKQKILVLIILGYVSCISGTISLDNNFVDSDGKNIINFIFIYILGHTIRLYKDKLCMIPTYFLIVIYLILNSCLVLFYLNYFNDMLGQIIYKIGYAYNSPVLILNAVILFLIASKWKFRSSKINNIAMSVFSVYLIQESPIILWKCIVPITEYLMKISCLPLILLPLLIILTFLIFFLCIVIDKICTPIWGIGKKLGIYLDFKFNVIWNKLN